MFSEGLPFLRKYDALVIKKDHVIQICDETNLIITLRFFIFLF